MIRRFCMSGVSRHSGSFAASAHETDEAQANSNSTTVQN
jgi:hypothetical protein